MTRCLRPLTVNAPHICAAPIVFAGAGLLNGRQATSCPSYREKLGGAYYLDKMVVEDGKIITSKGPGTAISFTEYLKESPFEIKDFSYYFYSGDLDSAGPGKQG